MAETGLKKILPMRKDVYNNGGGEPPMKNDYVTHEELKHAADKLSSEVNSKIDLLEAHLDNKFEAINTKFETVNTKIAEQENKQIKWFIVTAIAIISITVGLIKLL